MKVTHWLVTKLISIFQQQQQRKQSLPCNISIAILEKGNSFYYE